MRPLQIIQLNYLEHLKTANNLTTDEAIMHMGFIASPHSKKSRYQFRTTLRDLVNNTETFLSLS